MKLNVLLLAVAGAVRVQSAAVFAHFMVGNTADYTESTWRTDIRLAKEAHIDAFALNMAHGESMNEVSLERAFNVAKDEGFKLLFSFDYAGRGPWPKETVISYLKKYTSKDEYFKHNWIDIKSQVNCFFIPDWSSEGARPALALGNNVADGLFNWAAWPWGPRDMDTYVNASYFQYLDKRPYVMPVSPWFYTNIPGYNKNWMWRGDDIWHDRWIQVIYNQPEYVQTISWNDYGESHHIGSLYSHAMEAFTVGKAPYNYANNRPHDGWRQTLPFWIDYYKTGKATVSQESLVIWYRTSPSSACSEGGTVGNTASRLQIEFPPQLIMLDKIFFSAVLGSAAELTVTVGGKTFTPTWSSIPDGGVGVYHGSVVLLSETGDVNVQLSRPGRLLARVDGPAFSSASCDNGRTNWNPWVGSAVVAGSVSVTMPNSRQDQGYNKGTGAKGFRELCEFNCKYNYCPVSSCLCQAVGVPNTKPPALEKDGFPAKGKSENYSGLCSNACNLGFCPEEFCSETPQTTIVPTVSEFLPPACRAGTSLVGYERFEGLCSYACNFGFCPLHVCRCTSEGGLIEPPAQIPGATGKPVGGFNDEKLCEFACSRTWCPDVCKSNEDKDTESPMDPNDTCKEIDRTYSDLPIDRNGEYMRWLLMEPENAAATGRQYITIVNLTPHPFKLTSTRSYQMDEFNWGDIPPGKARQNVAHYTGKIGANKVDDNGEAYYDIGNTGKRRVVFDLSGMGKGQREYRVPGQEVPVTLVITGSDFFRDTIRDRTVANVVMPGTHDAGMSKLTDALLSGGSEDNTQTQMLNMYDQLRAGSRWFDLRVSSVHQVVNCCGNYDFWTMHVSDEVAEVVIGRTGERFDDVINEINRFTDENPGEVIFLQFRYLVGVRNVPSLGLIYWDEGIKDKFFDKLKEINNRCPGLDSGLQTSKIGDLMDKNDNKGCVLIFLNTQHLSKISDKGKHTSADDGIYNIGYIDLTDAWPEKEDTREMAEWAIKKWTDKTEGNFYVAQWLSTPHFWTSTYSYGLQSIAVLPTNPALYWRGVNEISDKIFLDVILVDYIGMVIMNEPGWDALSAELYTLAIGLNLYTISENCDISKRRSPLLPSPKNLRKPPSPLVSQFNGIIFANGTTIADPPPGLHPGRVEVLKNGTVFSNGTILEESVPNPDFNSTLF
ncbi:hypothetical protein CFIO01_05622 [Colletotrichum fioriniae PJ7]|uniref:Mutanase n=1 Tax=Colletotrichum fioriniae PJ7 TaxID=1445577 RepID=A0A010S0K2_9PEZI|nr:hypothetical protein CFIO01_05622 [Colletotrichum fioriniae PJ7]